MTLRRPEPPELYIARPRVDAFLDAVPVTPVSVLMAPAGSGKTAAAAAWVDRYSDPDRVTWINPGERSVLAWLDTAASEPGMPPVAVVDGAQRLEDDDVAGLARLLQESPETQRLLFLTRMDLSFIPVSLALAGQVNALAFPELRFEDPEATALVRAHQPDASDEQIRTVLDRSRGWAAALVLGAQSLHGPAGPPPLIGLAPQPIQDYLSFEVIDQSPPALQQVLTAICQEATVTAEEATVLSGLPAAPALLAAAAAGGLLVTSSSGHRATGEPVWRLHPLLAEVLQRRTSPEGPDWATVCTAHERAAAYYLRVGDAAPAVRHAALTGDLDIHLSTLQEFAPELLARSQADVLRDALALIPATVRAEARDLQAIDAMLLREQGHHDAAKRAADRALRECPTADRTSVGRGTPRDLEIDLAILELWQARCGWRSAGRAAERAARALRCHHGDPGSVDEIGFGHDITGVSPLRSAWLMLELGVLQIWSDDLPAAGVHLQAAGRYAAGADLPRLTCAVLSMQAFLSLTRGAYQTAALTAHTCLQVHSEAGHAHNPISARAHLVRGWGRFHSLDLDGATADLAAFAGVTPDPFAALPQLYGRLLEANILTASGDMDRARRLLDDDAGLVEPMPTFAQRHTSLAQFRAAGFMGDFAAMKDQARVLRRAGFDLDADLVLAVTLGIGGQEEQAVRDLDRLLSDAAPVTTSETGQLSAVTAASAAVTRVALLQRIGAPDAEARAAALVPDMLTRLAPQKLIWLLSTGLLVTPRFTDLLVAEVGRPGAHPFAVEALEALRRHPRPYPDQTPGGPVSDTPLVGATDRYHLTGRELDVLRALVAGGSNSTIARALFVSDNTVKTHLAAVYRKLGVSSRREALDVGRRDGLL